MGFRLLTFVIRDGGPDPQIQEAGLGAHVPWCFAMDVLHPG